MKVKGSDYCRSLNLPVKAPYTLLLLHFPLQGSGFGRLRQLLNTIWKGQLSS